MTFSTQPISPSPLLSVTIPHSPENNSLFLEAAKELGLELVSQALGGNGSGLLHRLLLGLLVLAVALEFVTGTTTASVEITAILAGSNGGLGNDILVRTLARLGAYISNVAGACDGGVLAG